MKSLLKSNWPIVGAVLGTLIGVLLAIASRGAIEVAQPSAVLPVVHKSPQAIVADHTNWADETSRAALAPQMSEIRAFFVEARSGTRPFAEEALSFDSKWKLLNEKLFGGDEHRRFVDEAFQKHIFSAGRLEQTVESNVHQYVKHVDNVESELLVRLQSDLESLPPELIPGKGVDSGRLRAILSEAMQEALSQVHAEFQGTVAREVIVWIAQEAMNVAVTRLAVSAGIIGTGATAGVVSFGATLVVGFIVDAIISWIYDEVFDPVGEMSRMLDAKLSQLEELVIHGDGNTPGLFSRLSDYTQRRAAARRQALDAAVSPSSAVPAPAF